jgi:hypothetical protein
MKNVAVDNHPLPVAKETLPPVPLGCKQAQGSVVSYCLGLLFVSSAGSIVPLSYTLL